MVVFCENHEKRRRGKRKGEPGKKKAFAFFRIAIISSFSPLFSFYRKSMIFMSGLWLKSRGSFVF
jgi:hypothetical protein